MTKDQGCSYWHPFTCGKQIPECPANCQRKAAFDEYHHSEMSPKDSDVFSIPDTDSQEVQ